MNDKITTRHLSRKAIVHVRQSTALRIANDEESWRLQPTLQDKLRSLRWCEVEGIDDDLGRSTSGGVERSDFRRIVAEVSLANVGAAAKLLVDLFVSLERCAETAQRARRRGGRR